MKYAQMVENREHPSGHGGIQQVFKFDNGMGASVVRSKYSYGGEDGLYEVAVLKFTGPDKWEITYDTPITTDVVASQTPEEVDTLLDRIANLWVVPTHRPKGQKPPNWDSERQLIARDPE